MLFKWEIEIPDARPRNIKIKSSGFRRCLFSVPWRYLSFLNKPNIYIYYTWADFFNGKKWEKEGANLFPKMQRNFDHSIKLLFSSLQLKHSFYK